MDAKINRLHFALAIMCIIGFVSGCGSTKEAANVVYTDYASIYEMPNQTYNQVSKDVEKIEVYHFHGHQQCNSCIAVGKLAEETVNTYFADELKSGKVVFAHVNAELPENKDLAIKYGVTGSSLWIGTYINGEFHKEENANVWYKIGDEADYLSYLKSVLDKRLSGDLS